MSRRVSFAAHDREESEWLIRLHYLPARLGDAVALHTSFTSKMPIGLFDMQPDTFDVVIVGSGASGGTLASHLARRGVRVAIVEGGPRVNTSTDFNTHAMPFDFPTRQIPTMRPGKVGFDSERSRGVGGKTMLWNAVALRFSQRDFKGRTIEGAGEDWPIDYKDIAPYYETIEREVGLCGNRDGLEDLPDGVFLPPVPLKCSDEILKRAAQSLGANLIHVRKATLTVPTPTRPACHFCGNCMAGCDVVAKYNSADVHIAPAEKTGFVTVFHDCIVREVLVSDENRATGVRYVHRVHQREGEVRGRAVVVACACVQSIALLLCRRLAATRTGWRTRAASLAVISFPTSRAGSSACSKVCGARGRPTTRAFWITPTFHRSCTTGSGGTPGVLAPRSITRTGDSRGGRRPSGASAAATRRR